jgi:hypothetical protein
VGQLTKQLQVTAEILHFLLKKVFKDEKIELELAVFKGNHVSHDLSEIFIVELFKIWFATILKHKKDHG